MARFILFLVLLLVVVAGIGFYFNWLRVTHASHESVEKVAITIDKEKMKEDLQGLQHKAEELKDTVKEKGQELKKDAQDLGGRQTVEGMITFVDSARSRVTLTLADQKELAVAITPDTKIVINGRPSQIVDLRAGQRVTCVHGTRDGRHICYSLTVADARQEAPPAPPMPPRDNKLL